MASSSGDADTSLLDIAEDFGQRVDLTRRIREILANYPEGTTVLKELIQNADDAGATEVCFCLDRRKHGDKSLLYGELAAWQGPALLAYNNAQFSADDFDSISKLGGSTKHRDPWKTGRFGVGFNSVYHLSDLPSFVSGRHIVFFDPHCKFLPKVSAVNPGKRIDFVKSAALSHYRDQFVPYCAFGCDMEKDFPGTLFRFPLRTVSQAAQSQLSRQHYSEKDVAQLFDELSEEASLCMLFLKNVEVIKFYEWHPGSENLRLLYCCSLESPTTQMRWHRHALTRLAKAWTSQLEGGSLLAKQLDFFVLHFNTQKFVASEVAESKVESFMIVQCLETYTSRIGAMSSLVAKQHGVCLLPWAAVAAKISADDKQVNRQSSCNGKAFCFLPLPLKTNLPIHVNGFFELSSNRRDIWYGGDMEGMGKIRADWNTLLLNEVVTSAYQHLLLVAPENDRLTYSFWPSELYADPWKNMVATLYKIISKDPILYSEINGGEWISLSRAVLHDEDMPNCDKQALVLIALGLPLVRLPKHLFQTMSIYCDFKVVCPNLVRQHLKSTGIHGLHIDWDSGLHLLQYCLADVVDEEASANLSGLPLVPLASGKFGVFGNRKSQVLYFLCTQKQQFLMEKVKHKIIERNIPMSCLQRLSQMAEVSSTNLSLLSATDFVKCLMEILPAEWKDKDVVQWMPNKENHPSEDWMVSLWKYFRESCPDLSLFDSWPLLPTNDGFLCRTQRSLGIIKGNVSFSKSLESILVKIGCQILKSDLCGGHPWLSKCVQSPTAEGILDAISCTALKKGCMYEEMLSNTSYKERNELRSFLLDARWYRENQMRENHLQVLKSLPIFEVHKARGCKEKQFVDLLSAKRYLPPASVDESLVGESFLHTKSQKEIEVLTKALNVQQMDRATFFRYSVIDRIEDLTSNIREQAMLTILKELPLLCLQDPALKDTLRNLSFIPTPVGELRPAKFLYDPRIEEFRVLLDEKESFPSEAFRTEQVLDALQLLGLQTLVSPNTVLQSARQIELMLQQIPDEATTRGFLLLSYLEVNAAKLFQMPISNGINSMFSKVTDIFQSHRTDTDNSKKFWNELASICWCPVLVQPPYPGLPWPSVTTPLAPPKLVRLPADVWLASASMRILNGDCRSAFLSQKLGWNSRLGGNVLAAQLLELGRNHAYADSQGLKQALATVIPRMYAFLNDKTGTEELEIVKTILEGSQWVWVGDKFVSAHEAVLSGPLHLAPYLWVIPADLAVFKELLLELGVKESLSTEDFACVLSKMALLKSNMPLDSLELKTVIWILQHLADSGLSGMGETILVPDAHSVLVPSSQLAYNDAPWLLGDSQSGGMSLDVMIGNKSLPRFVHANISNDVAERLSIKSFRRLLLAESADSLNVTLHGAAEAFGQHEALTTRLRHIVDMYADGPGILCELLQNSDDAGSSKVSFLLDQSQYGSSSLLSPRMSDWQGPALYCFNDSVFTTKDLHAISRIGQDSKLEKPHAVGRFGLGFNSVYHFTDVPSFVSGNNFVIFDPHASHLPGISPSHPGLKINYVGKGIPMQFPDQCRPYMLFGCDLQGSFNGTLFRFPLRTSVTASQSQIKQNAYSPEMVLSLFKNFQIIASEVLLFLHNVTSVSVYVREGLDQEIRLLYQVEKLGAYKNSVYSFIRSLRDQARDSDDFYWRLHNTPKERLPSDCQLVSIATHVDQRQSTQVWMVSDYLGGQQAVEMATSMDNRVHGFVPWAGVAAKIGTETGFSDGESSDSKRASLEGRAFCFLPLPVKTGLPLHVNAYFELSANRRDIWYGDDMAGGGKLRSEWNCCLLKEVSSIAYVRLLANAACQLGLSEDYFSLWPTGSPSEPWASLLRGVYLSAAELDIPVLFTNAKGGQWISPKKAVFPDCSYLQAVELGNALADAGLSVVTAPQSVVNNFQENCPSLRYLTPQLLRSSLIRRQRALNSRAAMLLALRYCLSDLRVTESAGKLEGLPLVPLATGMFGTFTCSSTVESIIVADEMEFKLLRDSSLKRLVDRSIDSEVFRELYAIAQSQSTNLVLLSPILLKDLLPRILPSDWHDKHVVPWTPGEAGHPSEEWMELLWRFLSLQSADLSLFTKWPLLPTSDEHHLLQLTKGSCILMGEKWSENMVSMLHKAKCFLLSSSITINHPQLGEFVHSVTASGLLGALFAAAGGFKGLPEALKEVSDLEMQELRGFLLQRKWFIDDSMGAVQIAVLKHLPIFKSYKSSTFVNLSYMTHFLPPNDIDVQLLGDDFIQAESEKEESILTGYLGIEKLGKQGFYENYAFKNLASIPFSVQEKVVLNLLRDFSSLKEEVPCIQDVLSQVPLIPTMHGKLKSPKELYDPRIQELHSLIDENFFPATEFAEAGVLDVLLELGLKSSLGLEDLLDSATCVASASLTDELQALKMGKSLLAYIDSLGLNLENKAVDNLMISDPVFQLDTSDLEKNTSFEQKLAFEGDAKLYSLFHDISEMKNKDFWLKLSGISWCPVLVEAPILDLPWPKVLKNMLAPPKIVRPKSQMWHVSATMRILDGEFRSKLMMSRLGWLEKPNLSILVMQLIELSERHAQAQLESSSKLDTTDSASMDTTDSDTRLSSFNKLLDEVIPTLYNLMEESLNPENIPSLKSMLEGIHWVWVGDGFVLPKEAAFVSPSHFQPYLHFIPETLLIYKTLLLALGVRETFGVSHFANVLLRVSRDMNGHALNKELLDFVVRVLEAIDELLLVGDSVPNQSFLSAIMVPDSSGILTPAKDLIYNDAPWLAKSVPGLTEMKRLVHPNVQNELAERLGAKSLRYLSFVDKEMTKDLPCLSSDDILNILANYGEGQSLIFDLLEIADKCKAHKVHVLYDKRVHAQTSILQPNLGQFQGAALTVVFEGTDLTTEEVCNLQLSPSWCRREQNSNYGAGLLSCYNITDLLLVVSKGCLYLFDPSGSILAPSITTGKLSVSSSPQGKVYTLQGTDIPHRFADQFLPFAINQDIFWGKPNITMLRMPLYKDITSTEDPISTEGSTSTEQKGGFRTQSSQNALDCILKNFISHAPTVLLFLNSVEAVHLSTWEADDSVAKEFFSVKVDPACAALRNPFVGKSTKKFQLSTIFNSSNNATKMNTIDVFINQNGDYIMDKWLVALSFGSSVTKTLALDRRFLSYNLSPVAGVAAHVSRNGALPLFPVKSTFLCPLPLAVDCRLPVVILGCFIVSHEGFRHLFQSSSVNEVSASVPFISQQAKLPIHMTWNQELMACVREAYIELLSECMYPKQDRSSKNSHNVNLQISKGTWKMLSAQSYALWPLSQKLKPNATELTQELNSDRAERNWLVELLIKPMYVQLADLPVWKLHGGFLAKATEGMFLSNPSNEQDLPPGAVCEFLKEHYKVFAVPCELTRELQAAGVNIKVITPKMVRYLLRALPAVSKFSTIDRYIELLEYSCADFGTFSAEEQARSGGSSPLLASSVDNGGNNFGQQLSPGEEMTLLRNRSTGEFQDAGRDSVDIVGNIRRAFLQFGKAVEDFSTEAGQKIIMQNHTYEPPKGSSSESEFEKWIGELKGLPCPTATSDIFRLGKTEAWVGNVEQQKLLMPLASRFIHRSCLDRPLLSKIFDNRSVQQILQIKPFTDQILSDSMAIVLPKQWSTRVTTVPWVEWNSQTDAKLLSPNTEWLHLFWKNIGVAEEQLSLFGQWPLVPAVVGSAVLVKVQFLHLVFMPPRDPLVEVILNTGETSEENERTESLIDDFQTSPSYNAFTEVQQSFPWLFPFLQQCKVPIFDQNFLDCKVAEACKAQEGQSLGQAIRSKLLGAQQFRHFVLPEIRMTPSDCDALFSLFAHEFHSLPSVTTTCTPAEIALLRSLPIHKTTVGTHTSIDISSHCIVKPTAFFQPQNDLCLQYCAADVGGAYYQALGIQELSDTEILLKFCFPLFGVLDSDDQERTLLHVYSHWENLQHNDDVVTALGDTKFVLNGDSSSSLLFQPRDLLDPTTSLFMEVYKEKTFKFPARRFTTDKWLNILRKSGLRCTLDAEALLGCAKEIEERWNQSMDAVHESQSSNEISEEMFLIAGKVVKAVLANLASVYGSSFFQPLSEIAFVPAERGLPVKDRSGGKRVLASYKQLVLVKDWPLAWTCAPILVNEGFIPPEFSWHSLHLKSPPHFQTVLKHLQIVGEHDGEDILARWPSVDGMMRVEDAFFEILKYLDKSWEGLSSHEKTLLQKIPFIPVSNGTRLCLANRIFVRLEVNLAPFVFQLPSSYLPFVKLLTDLGMQESPTSSRMQGLLLQMQNACGYERLNPNELSAVLRIIEFMCGLSANDKQPHILQNGTVVPDESGRLVHAQACVYIDAHGRAMVSKIDTSRLRFVHPNVQEQFCIRLGVRKLSEVVAEVLDDSVPLEFTDYFGNISKDSIVQRLKSESFQQAVWTLIQDLSQEIPNLKPLLKCELERQLFWLAENLKCAKHLNTRFVIVNGDVDITKRNSSSSSEGDPISPSGHSIHEYIDKKNGKVLLAQPPDVVLIPEILSVMISKLLDSPTFLPLAGLFNVAVGSECIYVEIMRLRPVQHVHFKYRLKNNQGIVLGDELSTNDARQVQVHPLRPYYGGEIVAWCSNFAPDTKLRYGMVVEDVRAPSGQAVYYLQVETGSGEILSLLSSNVFSFKSLSIGNEIHTSSDQVPLSTYQAGPSIHGTGSLLLQHSSLPTKDSEKNAQSFSTTVQAAAVVHAVNDMMAAVGFPLGLDQQTLLSQALTLEERLKAAQVALSSEQKRADVAVKEAEAARASWQCRICLSSEVNNVLVPCGHVLCRNCGSAVARCPFCRQSVSKSLNLYRP